MRDKLYKAIEVLIHICIFLVAFFIVIHITLGPRRIRRERNRIEEKLSKYYQCDSDSWNVSIPMEGGMQILEKLEEQELVIKQQAREIKRLSDVK